MIRVRSRENGNGNRGSNLPRVPSEKQFRWPERAFTGFDITDLKKAKALLDGLTNALPKLRHC
jgi:hypothetical protein